MKHIITALLMLAAVSAEAGSGKVIPYTVDGKSFEGYFISPSPKAPLVLLVHDWDGLTDYEIKRANMLADQGYSVFAVDLYGAGVRPTKNQDKRRHMVDLYDNRQKMRSYLRGGLDEAAAQGGDVSNAVSMGYCFGGAVVLELARSGADLKGFVTFHGGLKTPEDQNYSETKGKLLILHGTADVAIPMDQFAKLANELEEKDVAHEMIAYSGAPHGFTNFSSPNYTEDADKKSWKRFSQFLKETLER